jgi:hypothetical protein
MSKSTKRRNRTHRSTTIYTPRGAFWAFCVRAAERARNERNEQIRGDLNAYDIDKLFVDQGWKCAVSGIAFDAPIQRRQPFGPSVDRIAPGGKYVLGNIRIVCNIVNFAMNEWGEAALRDLVARMGSARELSGNEHNAA